MLEYRTHYRHWLLTLVTWDGLLPVLVLVTPAVVSFFFPNQREAREAVGILLPIVAFLVRFCIGLRHIKTNHCNEWLRRLQVVALILGLFQLVMIDSLVLLAHEMPIANFKDPAEFIVWGVIITIYLIPMAIALYPGRKKILVGTRV